MEPNRTSSFPADDKSAFQFKALMALALSVVLIAIGGLWVSANKSKLAGLALCFLAAAQSFNTVLYYRHIKSTRKKKNESAGP